MVEPAEYLASRGITDPVLIEHAGATVESGRVVFPWHDAAGHEIYRTGRAINGTEPKYRHSPGPRPPLFATPTAWSCERVGLVEGQIDALALAQAGLASFATSGSSLAAAAVEILAAKKEVVCVPDSDEAGARWRAEVVEKLAGRTRLFEVRLPPGVKDIAEAGELAIDPAEAVAALVDAAELVRGPGDIFLDWPTFWAKDRREPEWLYDDVLAFGRAHSIFASHKAGKSLFMLYAVVRMIAAGSVVVYLDFEMTEADLIERLEDMGVGPETDLSRLRYALLPSLPPLDTAAGAKALLEIIDRVQANWPDRHVVAVIDTTARALEGDENDADTIQAFYRHAGLGLKQRGVTWVRLDHAGKDPTKGQRGSSAKGDDVDLVWRLVQTDNGIALHRDASRIGWAREKVTFRQIDEPLRFVRVTDDWMPGTADLAGVLERLGVPVTEPVRAASKKLRGAGHKARTTLITAAQRYRREAVDNDREAVNQESGNASGNAVFEDDPETLWETGGE